MSENYGLFIQEPEARARHAGFSIIKEALGTQARREIEPDMSLIEKWKQVVPQSNWGDVSLSTALPEFEQEFLKALQEGTGNDFLKDNLARDVYAACANPEQFDPEASKQLHTIASNYQPDSLNKIEDKLDQFEKEIGNSTTDPLVSAIYKARIESTRRHIRAARVLGTPEFTLLQKPSGYWETQVDHKASKEQGTVVLKYEQQARELIEHANTEKVVPITMKVALDGWNFSDSEKNQLDFDSIINQGVLSPEQGKKLFEVLARRISDQITITDSVRTLINANARKNQLEYPTTRTLTPDEVRYLPGHEFVHLVRGINGYKQQASICGEGEEGYLETEEGLAVLTEMILGQPFGHVRQQEFAARYLAVSMALKSKQVDGNWQAMYSAQDIYDYLVARGISEKSASSTTWRVLRGTSLKRQTTDLTIGEGDDQYIVKVAECYEKDTVYFRGIMRLFEWARDTIPVPGGMKRSLTTQVLDFSSPDTLRRIGASGIAGYTEMKRLNKELESRGRDHLFTILQYMLVGKMTFESIVHPDSPWRDVFTRSPEEGIVDIRKLLGHPQEV